MSEPTMSVPWVFMILSITRVDDGLITHDPPGKGTVDSDRLTTAPLWEQSRWE
jgi:hypothetical protein